MVFICKSIKLIHDKTFCKVSVYLAPSTQKKNGTHEGIEVIEKHGYNSHQENYLY